MVPSTERGHVVTIQVVHVVLTDKTFNPIALCRGALCSQGSQGRLCRDWHSAQRTLLLELQGGAVTTAGHGIFRGPSLLAVSTKVTGWSRLGSRPHDHCHHCAPSHCSIAAASGPFCYVDCRLDVSLFTAMMQGLRK